MAYRKFDNSRLAKKGQYFFTTEFCPGQELLEALSGRDTAYFEEALIQILSALDCIHARSGRHPRMAPARRNLILTHC